MTEHPKLLIAEPDGFSNEALTRLRSRFAVQLGPVDRAAFHERIRDCAGVFVRFAHQIDADLLRSGNQLAFIASPTTGLNHVDTDTAERRGVRVLSLRGERAFLASIHSTAELTWGLLLSLTRRIPAAIAHVDAGGWDRDQFKGHDLAGKILGIVGFGRLGSTVARYGAAFGMAIVATDPQIDTPEGVTPLDLNTLCERADVISLHVPSRPDTRKMIGADQLARMRRSCLLINTSRGDLIDEPALLEALSDRRIAGAGLDVLREEFESAPASAALRRYAATHDNLLITPHIGGATHESMEKTELFLVERLFEAIDNGDIRI